MYVFRLIPSSLFILLLWGVGTAHAADPMGAVPVRDRVFEAYEPRGLRLGTFMFYPAFDAAVGHATNIDRTQTGEEVDSFAILSPSLRGEGRFGVHRLALDAQARRPVKQA